MIAIAIRIIAAQDHRALIAVAGVKEKGLHVDIKDGLARIRMTLAGKPAAMLMFGH